MLADRILTQLDGVKITGQDRWIAKCPSHDDKSPSLAIREVDDRLLLHCFAGCDVNEIISSIGLDLSDLFPEKINHKGNKPISRPFPATDILKCISFESLFLKMCVLHLKEGKKLTDRDSQRLNLADKRISLALKAGGLQ